MKQSNKHSAVWNALINKSKEVKVRWQDVVAGARANLGEGAGGFDVKIMRASSAGDRGPRVTIGQNAARSPALSS